MIYLDNASTTKPSDAVSRAMDEANRNLWANASSSHPFGCQAAALSDHVKREAARRLSCLPDELIFTSGATESINTILKGFFGGYPDTGMHLITSAVEHSAVIQTCRYLEQLGITVTYLQPGSGGQVDLHLLEKEIRNETSLISLMHVNNETGALLDIDHLVEIRNKKCKKAKIHIDSAQSLGKFDYRYGKSGVDYASFSAHKLHGPKGIGLIFKSKSAPMAPLHHGGGQERGFRSGTANIPAMAGFFAAIEQAYAHMKHHFNQAETQNELLVQELMLHQLDFIRISPSGASPYIINLAFRGVRGEILSRMLANEGIYTSTSSACSSKDKKKNRIIHALKIDPAYREGVIRFSFCYENTEEEIRSAAQGVKDAINFLKDR